jgi:hypothetical protein
MTPRRSHQPRVSRTHRFDRRLIALAPVLVVLAAICAATGQHAGWLAIPLILLTYRLAALGRGRRGGSWSRTR